MYLIYVLSQHRIVKHDDPLISIERMFGVNHPHLMENASNSALESSGRLSGLRFTAGRQPDLA